MTSARKQGRRCVEALAAELACDEAAAEGRHEAMLAFMHELVQPGLVPAPDPDR